jgi:HEPN domain-containing protein
MPNWKIANEWLSFAIKSLETAILLNRENHYTDVIAVDIQQAIEKAFKSVYAYYGEKIPRTHSLEILFHFVAEKIDLEDVNTAVLIAISDYYQIERYPGPRYFQPEKKEIAEAIQLAKLILNRIDNHIHFSGKGETGQKDS